MSDEEKKNVSIRGIDKGIWDKAVFYRRQYGYDTVAQFVEEAIEMYCLRLDKAREEREQKEREVE